MNTQDNPGLHLLYVKWACVHLQEIDNSIKRLSAFSNLNMLDTISALHEQRGKLVKENAAYRDAEEICRMLRQRSISVDMTDIDGAVAEKVAVE